MNTSALDKVIDDRDSLKNFDLRKFHVFQIWNFALSLVISASIAIATFQVTKEAIVALMIFGLGAAVVSALATYIVYKNGYVSSVSQMLPIATAFFAISILQWFMFFDSRTIGSAAIAAYSLLFIVLPALEYLWHYLPKFKEQIAEAGKPSEIEQFYFKEFGVRTTDEYFEIFRSATEDEKVRMTNLYKAQLDKVLAETNDQLHWKKSGLAAIIRLAKSLGVGLIAGTALFLFLLPFVKKW